MPEEVFNWIGGNRIEVLGALLGLVYIFFSIRQSMLTWPVGLTTSVLYCYVFFAAKFYADMSLQVYYVGVSLYGWYYWMKGSKDAAHRLPVTRTPRRLWGLLTVVSAIIFAGIALVLVRFTDSPIPRWDAFTTALSVTATWMLARKYLEHWIIWVFVDLVSAVLYATRNLWATAILFTVYTVMAVFGYIQWRKEMKTD